ncbi:DeoR/GlpR transcriptional regulator [Proteiniclasticum sp. SCR006]|uniref:DeoR/GlpR transcriptional regulator n=1 Tax=Proteiniclasticum aestuarii TaxID=2817862 RepID=A0A939KK74_9CLOT|nr:DeoR/GlpR family DNA-binding transcription regulator [Proteiniclasticum aestuarii]MBO1264435.1 DeoR/GlpR transcriptional regulator [Proteiniclasticum aestuarii]
MFAEERQRKIIEMMEESSSLKVAELAAHFDVSESTIRRDLQELEEHQILKRTHGGAVSIQKRGFEPTFKEKKEEFSHEKKRIGELAAELVEDGYSVILDTGTTTLEIAKRIRNKKITVITNSLDIAEELSEVENIELIMTGGTLRGNTRAMVGYLTENTLKNFRADIAFIGANGITGKDGATTPNHVEAMTKRAMIASANRVYLVADTSKFGNVSFAVITPVNQITGIITAGEMNEETALVEKNKEIEIVK